MYKGSEIEGRPQGKTARIASSLLERFRPRAQKSFSELKPYLEPIEEEPSKF